jgi:hypothetical protein
MSALCKDCGMDTEPWPPHRGTQEHYVVKDEVWQQAGMPLAKMDDDLSLCGGGGFLCVGCIEKRLGRLLTINDFAPITLDLLKDCQNTPRLLSRVGIAFMAIAHKPLPDHIVDRWLEATLKNAISEQMRIDKVEIDGDAVLLIRKDGGQLYRAGPVVKALREHLRWDRHGKDELPDGRIDLLAWEDEAA